MKTYIVTSRLVIHHTDTVQANSQVEAEAIVDTWLADDFTEDADSSRSWDIEVVLDPDEEDED